eukprot:6170869-Prymnesium_polylepis.1
MGKAHGSAFHLKGRACLECLPHVIETKVLTPIEADLAHQGGKSLDELVEACKVDFEDKDSPEARAEKFVVAVRS